MKKKKIVLSATYSGFSGATFSLVKLAEELRDDYDITVLTPGKGLLCELLEKKRIHYTRVSYYPWVINIDNQSTFKNYIKWQCKKIINLWNDIRIYFILKEIEPDIFHINASTSSIGVRAAIRLNIPIVWHIREFLEEDLEKKFWNKEQTLELMNKSSKVISISKAVESKYSNYIDNNIITTVYNGVDTKLYPKVRRKRLGGSCYKICILGRITSKKGQLEVVKEFHKIIKNDNLVKVVLEIVGPRSDELYVKKIEDYIQKNNLQRHVKIKNAIKNVAKYLESVDISVINSSMEAFGRVTVESVYSGAITLGRNSGGTPEILEHEKLLFNDDLYEKLRWILNNPIEVDSIMNAVFEKNIKKFSSLNNARNISNIYEEITGDISDG